MKEIKFGKDAFSPVKWDFKVSDGRKAEVKIIDVATGRQVKEFTQPLDAEEPVIEEDIENVESWNPETPTFFDTEFTLLEKEKLVFSKKERIGFRNVEFRENDVIYINCTKLVYKRVNRHFFYPTSGSALSEANHLMLHGFYDGGHGASLDDFWADYMKNPRDRGRFLWKFSDEAVLRTDLSDTWNADGDNTSEGILGLHREKKGSYFTNKDIWFPVQIKPMVLNDKYNGQFVLENHYLNTDLEDLILYRKLKVVKDRKGTALSTGNQKLKNMLPGESSQQRLDLPADFAEIKQEKDNEGNQIIGLKYCTYPRTVKWTLSRNGQIKLETAGSPSKSGADFFGINFSFTEETVKSIHWVGDGPYWGWQNHLRRFKFGMWEKDYNNTTTITGYNPDGKSEYLDFKSYHANLRPATQGNFKVYTERPGLFFRLFYRNNSLSSKGNIEPPFPPGDLSFLYKIPVIGNKFHSAKLLGSSALERRNITNGGDHSDAIILWCDFE